MNFTFNVQLVVAFSALLCDGITVTVAGGDEIVCPKNDITFFQKSTRDTLTQVTNFVHDTIISTDKNSYKIVRMSLLYQQKKKCNPTEELPCGEGHPGCYPIPKMCIYDHTDGGHLKYCSNGLHLHDCQNMDCAGSFKCRNSYCIPAHKVCDGKLDCPFGDGEGDCPLQGCTNMLYCGAICVHPSEICDGTIHCMEGEDELMCGAPDFPSWCQCHGYSVKCAQLVFDTTFYHIKMMSLNVSELTLHPLLFHNLRSLLILDLSHCDITPMDTKTHIFLHLICCLNSTCHTMLLTLWRRPSLRG